MAEIRLFNPEGLSQPVSPYRQVAHVKAHDLLLIAGQTPIDASGGIVGKGDFEAQCAQVFFNIRMALHSVAADWQNIVQFTSYLVRPQDITAFRTFRNNEFPKMFSNGAYPPNTLLIVSRLADESFWLEVQAVAAL